MERENRLPDASSSNAGRGDRRLSLRYRKGQLWNKLLVGLPDSAGDSVCLFLIISKSSPIVYRQNDSRFQGPFEGD